MAVKHWHPGKLVLLWAVVGVLFLWGRTADTDDAIVAWLLLLIAAPTVLVLTWRWLSGREKQ